MVAVVVVAIGIVSSSSSSTLLSDGRMENEDFEDLVAFDASAEIGAKFWHMAHATQERTPVISDSNFSPDELVKVSLIL